MSEQLKPQTGKPKGLLNEKTSKRNFNLSAYDPPKSLETIVDKIWHVQWAFENQDSYEQTNLPHPTQHIVINPSQGARFIGCSTEVFKYKISGKGQVIGLKLFPGMGRVFYDEKLSQLTNKDIPLTNLIGGTSDHLEDMAKQGEPPDRIIEILTEELHKISNPQTQAMISARQAVETIAQDRELFRVDTLCEIMGSSPRKLQRLFADYIGVSPKWVINRYRMLDLLETLNTGDPVDFAELALDFGFTDQSHFTTQFKAITGQSPAAYLKQQRV